MAKPGSKGGVDYSRKAGTGYLGGQGITMPDLKRVEQQFKRFGASFKRSPELEELHESVARMFVRSIRSNIKPSPVVARVRRKGKGPGYDIEPGTMRRSVWHFKLDDRYNTYFAGPRVGRKVPWRKDGWFANIVEEGDMMFNAQAMGGKANPKNNRPSRPKMGMRNKGAIAKGIKSAQPQAEAMLFAGYKKIIEKYAREAMKS